MAHTETDGTDCDYCDDRGCTECRRCVNDGDHPGTANFQMINGKPQVTMWHCTTCGIPAPNPKVRFG